MLATLRVAKAYSLPKPQGSEEHARGWGRRSWCGCTGPEKRLNRPTPLLQLSGRPSAWALSTLGRPVRAALAIRPRSKPQPSAAGTEALGGPRLGNSCGEQLRARDSGSSSCSARLLALPSDYLPSHGLPTRRFLLTSTVRRE